MKKTMILLAALLVTGGSWVGADEILFKNGDKLSGEIKSAEGDTLVIATKVAGEVKVKLSEVKTFSTDKPLELHLSDGTVLKQPIVQAEEGKIATAPGGLVQAQAIPVEKIKQINPPPVSWKGALLAGATLTRGNTYTDSLSLAFDATRRSTDDRISLGAQYLYSREKSDGKARVTVENWKAMGKYDYFFTDKWYGYVNSRVERDHIANLDLRLTPGAGVGYQWIESAKANFNTEAGVSWVYERYTDPDTTRSHVAARLAYHYDRKLSDQVSFFHNLEFLPSVENFNQYLVTADAGIRAKLTNDFFSELKVELTYNSEPAAGKLRTDVRYIASLGWAF